MAKTTFLTKILRFFKQKESCRPSDYVKKEELHGNDERDYEANPELHKDEKEFGVDNNFKK